MHASWTVITAKGKRLWLPVGHLQEASQIITGDKSVKCSARGVCKLPN